MSATVQPNPSATRARRVLATIVIALVLAVALVAIAASLVMSASPSAAHGAFPGLDHSGGLHRFLFSR